MKVRIEKKFAPAFLDYRYFLYIDDRIITNFGTIRECEECARICKIKDDKDAIIKEYEL